jgi:hypothetical protein
MDDINDALIEAVKAAGGSANVGAKLWPEKTPQSAQRLLLDCLNPERPAHLTPDHVMLIARMARAKGHHGVIEFMADGLGYSRPTPTEPRDEAAELQRQFIAAVAAVQAITNKLEANGSRLYAPLRAA